MKRIAIIGSAGAGKSTLARQLGEVLGLEVIHLDLHYWKPGWVPTPPDEWDSLNKELVRKDRWIIDGNYGRTLDIRVAAADTIIFLDYSRYLCVYRAMKRSALHRPRPDLAAGCQERLNWEALKFLLWIWNYPQRSRPKVLERLQSYAPGREIIVLKSPVDTKRFIEELRRKHTQ